MKMITLNLLSPEMKRDITRRILFLVLKNSLAVVLIVITVCAAALLGSKFALTNTFNALVEQSALITREYSGINAEIRTLNRELNQLKEIEERSTPLSPVLAHLYEIAPPGISFTALTIDSVNSFVRIQGRASTRETLVAFHGKLEESELLEKIRSPLSNIVVRTDIPFEFYASFPGARTPAEPTPAPPKEETELLPL